MPKSKIKLAKIKSKHKYVANFLEESTFILKHCPFQRFESSNLFHYSSHLLSLFTNEMDFTHFCLFICNIEHDSSLVNLEIL